MSLTVAMDSGAIIALSRGDRTAIALLRYFRAHGAYFIVPAPVLTETLRGGKTDAAVYRIVNAMQIATLDKTAARDAGARLGATGSTSVIDAMIVAVAVQAGATDILTSDPTDISKLTQQRLHVVQL